MLAAGAGVAHRPGMTSLQSSIDPGSGPSAAEPRIRAPDGLRVRLPGRAIHDFVVLEWPRPAPAARPRVPPAESEVLRLVLEGLSNAEIARARGRAARTVANQLARLYRKFGVRSRLELYARFAAGRGDAEATGGPEPKPAGGAGEALAVWNGLMAGTWSPVEYREGGGHHLVVARRSGPGARDPRALRPRERQVIAMAARGHQNKYIGWLLGIEPSTVATHLESARRKLGLPSRRGIISTFGPLVG